MSELKRHRKKQKRRKSRHLLAGSSAFYAGVFSCIAAAIVVSALLSVYFPTAAKPEKEKPKAVEVSAEPSTSKNRLLSLIQLPETLFSTNRFWNLPFIWIPRTGPMITHPFSPTAKISCQRPIIPLSPLKVLL